MAEMITAMQVAKLLGVTDARVRQLTASGRLSSHSFGPRVVLYDRAEVDIYSNVTNGAAEASGIAATAPDAEEQLELTTDSPFRIPGPRFGQHSLVHVRIWRSDSRTIVVVSSVAESIISLGGWIFEDCIMPAIAQAYLDGQYLEPIWFTITNTDHDILVQNRVVLAKEIASTRRWLRPSRKELHIDVRVLDIEPAANGLAQIERLTGDHILVFPEQQYATTENIARLAKERRPIPVRVDTAGLRELAVAARMIAEYSENNAFTVRIALRAITSRISAILDAPETMRRPGWMDAGDNSHWAIDSTVDPIGDIEWRHLADGAELAPHELRSGFTGLGAWLDTINDSASERDRDLAGAATRAMDLIAHMYTLRSFHDQSLPPLPPYPATTPTPFDVNEIADEYWNQASDAVDDDTTDARRLRAEVAKRIEVFNGDRLALRTSGDGTPIARYTWGDARRDEELVAMWPYLTADFARMPDGSRIVSTADGPGPLDVYIRTPDGLLTPLPLPNDAYEHIGWNYGYSGAGPAALGYAIGKAIEIGDRIHLTRNADRLIEGTVETAPKAKLDISIDELRAAMARLPADED